MNNMNIRKLPSNHRSKIIEVLVPIRFYWHDGEFDGIEMGPMKKRYPITKYQIKLMHELLDLTSEFIKRDVPIPGVIQRAFDD